MYEYGLGLEQSFTQAAAYYLRAAEKVMSYRAHAITSTLGHTHSLFHSPTHSLTHSPYPSTYPQSFTESMYHLGLMYAHGRVGFAQVPASL